MLMAGLVAGEELSKMHADKEAAQHINLGECWLTA